MTITSYNLSDSQKTRIKFKGHEFIREDILSLTIIESLFSKPRGIVLLKGGTKIDVGVLNDRNEFISLKYK